MIAVKRASILAGLLKQNLLVIVTILTKRSMLIFKSKITGVSVNFDISGKNHLNPQDPRLKSTDLGVSRAIIKYNVYIKLGLKKKPMGS